VTARSMSSSLYAAGVHESPLTTPTVRMSILSLLFVLIFLPLVALDSLSLSQIVVLVINHTLRIHVVVLFLIVRINLYITKLLLFPTLQKPDRH
jgi:hypothetical protein